MAQQITIKGEIYELNYVEDLTQATDAQKKHTPHIDVNSEGDAKVTIGNFGITHPQTPEHYIGWIRLLEDDIEIAFQEFTPDMQPELMVMDTKGRLTAQAWCNLHGVWEARA